MGELKGLTMNILSTLEKINETSCETIFLTHCESCNKEFIHGEPLHTLRIIDPDRPMAVVCDQCFNVGVYPF